ncbi:hypothetical protein ACFFGH_11615 [Lysobacter korlensis]|uniref:Chemotaxis protein n=1 Tax=Lysobacter korlensis TaxID=553636 RepID=A0ABV6RND0_9GAMM
MSDSDLTPSFDEVSKTDAVTGTNAGSALDGPSRTEDSRAVGDADAAVDREMSNAELINSDPAGDVAADDSSETEEADDVGMSAEESPGVGVSEVDLDEADARADTAADGNDDDTGGGALAGDREEMFRLQNDVATNDAVAGETVLGESAPVDETPYQGGNELGDVDLGETEDR